jgi:hypothetical protein
MRNWNGGRMRPVCNRHRAIAGWVGSRNFCFGMKIAKPEANNQLEAKFSQLPAKSEDNIGHYRGWRGLLPAIAVLMLCFSV